jgi:hypothetical protein
MSSEGRRLLLGCPQFFVCFSGRDAPGCVFLRIFVIFFLFFVLSARGSLRRVRRRVVRACGRRGSSTSFWSFAPSFGVFFCVAAPGSFSSCFVVFSFKSVLFLFLVQGPAGLPLGLFSRLVCVFLFPTFDLPAGEPLYWWVCCIKFYCGISFMSFVL